MRRNTRIMAGLALAFIGLLGLEWGIFTLLPVDTLSSFIAMLSMAAYSLGFLIIFGNGKR